MSHSFIPTEQVPNRSNQLAGNNITSKIDLEMEEYFEKFIGKLNLEDEEDDIPSISQTPILLITETEIENEKSEKEKVCGKKTKLSEILLKDYTRRYTGFRESLYNKLLNRTSPVKNNKNFIVSYKIFPNSQNSKPYQQVIDYRVNQEFQKNSYSAHTSPLQSNIL